MNIFDTEEGTLNILNFLKHCLNMIDGSKGKKEVPDVGYFRRQTAKS